jgi:hypothetical protein
LHAAIEAFLTRETGPPPQYKFRGEKCPRASALSPPEQRLDLFAWPTGNYRRFAVRAAGNGQIGI